MITIMITEEKKLKIPSIVELEQELLADSTTADMELPDDTNQDADRVLMAAQVRHDVSTFARGYCCSSCNAVKVKR